MRSFNKRIKSMLLVNCLLTPFVMPVFSSCSQERITSISLFIQKNNIRPGESLYIKAIAEPYHRRINNLDWQLLNAPEGVTISPIGVISVLEGISFDDMQNIEVIASVKGNSSISARTTIALLPKPTLDFQGFENDELQCLDRAHNVKHIKIKPIDEFTYETEENVDLFVMDELTDAPSYFTSFVYFKPLTASITKDYMSFYIEGGTETKHAIRWDGGYVDNTWSASIPSFLTSQSSCPMDSIIVSFSCDPRVKLIINFDIWQSRNDQFTAGNMFYVPDGIDDNYNFTCHDLVGHYEVNVFCPDKEIKGTYSGHLGTIYACRSERQYTEFELREFEYEIEDPNIKAAFSVKLSPMELFIRPLDHKRIYKFSLDYTFDLAKKQYPGSHWNYESFLLGEVDIKDPLFPESRHFCYLELYLEWV